jgi:ribonucleoside-diphosphate reductase alpha chain
MAFATSFARNVYLQKYSHDRGRGKEEWPDTAERLAANVVRPTADRLKVKGLEEKVRRRIERRQFLPGGCYFRTAGRPKQQFNNCFLFRAEDSREGWATLMHDSTAALMTGGGVGVMYGDLRSEKMLIKGLGGSSTGPCALMQMLNEAGRHIMQGGSRRSAIWAGLPWWHPDVWKFIRIKQWDDWYKQGKNGDFNRPAPMDGTNVSVALDDDFFDAYFQPWWSRTYRDQAGNSWTVDHDWAYRLYWQCIRLMCETGEPGFSVDVGDSRGEDLRNACTEVTSRHNGDMCNLLSLNMAAFQDPDDFEEAVFEGTAFLMSGSMVSQLPVEHMYQVREMNRRLGLGLMGVHEWLLGRGYHYGPCTELGRWMDRYVKSTPYSKELADRACISRPIATRSIAPTGTISIVAETTSGIEPIPAVAYLRRYLDGHDWRHEYNIDPTAHRVIQQYGLSPDEVEDAMTLAADVGRRLGFQAWMQARVDQGISSTINLPAWGSPGNNEGTVTRFGSALLKNLPSIRGITAYPDGARGGQPITPCSYEEAARQLGTTFVQNGNTCRGGVCGE